MFYLVLMNVFRGIQIFFQVIEIIIVGYCLCSWILPPTNRIYMLLARFADPIIAPFRGLSMRLMMKTGLRIDLSAIFAIFALRIAQNLLMRLLGLIVGFFL